MPQPRLTIGIPTYKRAVERPELLQQALVTAMGQTIPTRVIVCDQGQCDETRGVCREWEAHPNFRRIESPATNLWGNWRHVAQAAADDGAEFFSWLQDDDGLSEKFASRVCRAMDFYPDAGAYCSNLSLAYDNLLGFKHVSNPGPKVPVDVVRGVPLAYPGSLLTILGYFDSWCMAPAKAFRVDDQFRAMLDALPDDCDCFTERLDVATASLGRRFIVDPKTAGYWNLHGKNESQVSGATQPEQVAPAYAYLDTLMDRIVDWRQELLGWMSCCPPGLVETYFKGGLPHRAKSSYLSQILDLFEDAMRGGGFDVDAMLEAVKEKEVAA
jgi:glycosyltransferase involved in cell wall biosynthesis